MIALAKKTVDHKSVKNNKIKALRLHDPQRKKLSLSLGLDILHCLKTI